MPINNYNTKVENDKSQQRKTVIDEKKEINCVREC